MNISADFKGKIVLITGTNAGIGKSIVKLLEKEKCTIIAASRKTKKIIKKNIFKTLYYENKIQEDNSLKIQKIQL